MKSSLNRWVQKPKTAQPSKKNSNTSSIIYKEINESIRNYIAMNDKSKKTNHERENKNKNKNISKKDLENKKNSLTPFVPFTNNFFDKKH